MPDTPVEALLDLDMLETVRLTVAGEVVTGVSNSKVVDEDRVVVLVNERDGDRTFRIETQWAHGWLDPIVDVRERDGPDGEFEPLGTLEDAEAVGYPSA